MQYRTYHTIFIFITSVLIAFMQLSVVPLFAAHHLAKNDTPAFVASPLPENSPVPPISAQRLQFPSDASIKNVDAELAELRSEIISLVLQKKTSSVLFKLGMDSYHKLLLATPSLSGVSRVEAEALGALSTKVLTSNDLSALDNAGYNLLQGALNHHHTLIVKYLLPLYAKYGLLNSTSKMGETALILAVKQNNSVCASFLVEAGAQTLITDASGKTALQWAREKNNAPLIALLSGTAKKRQEGEGIGEQVEGALEWDQKHTHDEQETFKTSPPSSANNQGSSPEHSSIPDDNKHTKDVLSKAGLPLQQEGLASPTASASHAHDKGADQPGQPHAQDKKNDNDTVENAVASVAQMQHTLSSVAAAILDSEHCNALHKAAKSGDMSTAQLLISLFAKTPHLNAQDKSGNTALILAAKLGYDVIVKMLIDAGADITKTDIDDRNALHWVSIEGKETTAHLLIPYFAKNGMLNVAGGKGYCDEKPALISAAEYGYDSIVKMLIDAGANMGSIDRFGHSALHRAALRGHETTVKLLIPFFTKGGWLNRESGLGETALMLAADHGRDTVVEALIQAGSDITKTRNSTCLLPVYDGKNALHLAAASQFSTYTTVKLLAPLFVKKGLLDAKDAKGHTALILARTAFCSQKNRDQRVDVLIEAGAKDEGCVIV